MQRFFNAYSRYVAMMLHAPLRRQIPVIGAEVLVILGLATLVTGVIGLVGGTGWQNSTFGMVGASLVVFDALAMTVAYLCHRAHARQS